MESQPKPKPGMAQDLLDDWRAAERESDGARAAVEVAGLAVETADAAKAAAAESEAAVTAAGEAVERAKKPPTSPGAQPPMPRRLPR